VVMQTWARSSSPPNSRHDRRVDLVKASGKARLPSRWDPKHSSRTGVVDCATRGRLARCSRFGISYCDAASALSQVRLQVRTAKAGGTDRLKPGLEPDDQAVAKPWTPGARQLSSTLRNSGAGCDGLTRRNLRLSGKIVIRVNLYLREPSSLACRSAACGQRPHDWTKTFVAHGLKIIHKIL